MTTHFIEIHSKGELDSLGSTRGVDRLNSENLVHDAPDAHWLMLSAPGVILARCSLWWKRTPPYPDQRLGLVGHYAATDAESASTLLRHACAQLASKGCTMAVGPMDGNTWRRYRFVTERGTEPPFFLEPDNPDDWPLHFAAEGFAPLATYISALNSDLSRVDPRLPDIAENVAGKGITIRSATAGKMEGELRRIYALSLQSFQKNFLYTPLDEAEFLAQYQKILPHVREELVLLAECNGQPVGFLFAIHDLLRPKRGEPNDTIIIKTVAVVPECASVGLGTLLVARAQETARGLGSKRVIHALMHESNRSRNISERSATIMRRYTLFSRHLSQ